MRWMLVVDTIARVTETDVLRSTAADHAGRSMSPFVRAISWLFGRWLAPTTDFNWVHVSERTRHEMGTGGP